MRVLPFRVPPFDNAMYVIVDDRGDALVIDPSMAEREVMATVRDEGLRLIAILNTHGHNDHIWANAAVKSATGARLAIHRLDAYRLSAATRPRISPESAALMGTSLNDVPEATADDLLDEGPVTYLRDVRIEALHTPGHTEGSTSFYLPEASTLFSGDVLFAGNVGRVDIPGGDARQMEASLRRVSELPPDTRVYPGHGPATRVADELAWLRDFRFPERAGARS